LFRCFSDKKFFDQYDLIYGFYVVSLQLSKLVNAIDIKRTQLFRPRYRPRTSALCFSTWNRG